MHGIILYHAAHRMQGPRGGPCPPVLCRVHDSSAGIYNNASHALRVREGDLVHLYHVIAPRQKAVMPNELFVNKVVELHEEETVRRTVGTDRSQRERGPKAGGTRTGICGVDVWCRAA